LEKFLLDVTRQAPVCLGFSQERGEVLPQDLRARCPWSMDSGIGPRGARAGALVEGPACARALLDELSEGQLPARVRRLVSAEPSAMRW
jgi:hypothetical protein